MMQPDTPEKQWFRNKHSYLTKLPSAREDQTSAQGNSLSASVIAIYFRERFKDLNPARTQISQE